MSQTPVITIPKEQGPASVVTTLPDLLIPLADLKTYLGITGTEQDAELTKHGAGVTELLRRYLGRMVNFVRFTVDYQLVSASYLWLPNPPVEAIHSVTVDGSNTTTFAFNVESGRVWLDGFAPICADLVQVDLEAGFANMPAALVDVFAALVNARLAAGVAAAPTGPVREKTIFDSHRIAYESTAYLAAAAGPYAGELEPYKTRLTPYIYHRELIG